LAQAVVRLLQRYRIMELRSTVSVLFLLHAAIAVSFAVQCHYALHAMKSEVREVECDVPERTSSRSWAPFIVAFAAGGAANVLGKGTSPLGQPASNWELARRDLLGKLHASSV